ncbi:MAG: hypothetical protein ACFNLP_08465 [Segatella oulorum]
MMKITPPARTSSPQTHLFIPIFGSNRASGRSSIPPFKPFSADMAARHATVRASFAGKIAKYVSKVDAFADVIVSYSRRKGFDDALQAMYSRKQGFDDTLQAMYSRKRGFAGDVMLNSVRLAFEIR